MSCFAGSTTGTISRILFIETGAKGLIYIYPEGGVNDPPACHGSNGDYYSFKADRPMAQEYITGLLAAFAAGKTVFLRGRNECVDQGVSETLLYFYVDS